MICSLRASAWARSLSSYSSSSRACRRSNCGWSHSTSGFSSTSTRPAMRCWTIRACPMVRSICRRLVGERPDDANLVANGSMMSNTLLTSRSSRTSATFLASASAMMRRRGGDRSCTLIGPPGTTCSSPSGAISMVTVSSSRRSKRADDARTQSAQHVVLLDRRQSDQHRRAIAEQHDLSVVADTERQRISRDHVAALKSHGIDALAQTAVHAPSTGALRPAPAGLMGWGTAIEQSFRRSRR